MEFTEKEEKYIRKSLASGELDVEIVLSVLNSKRTATKQVSASDLSEYLTGNMDERDNVSDATKRRSDELEGSIAKLQNMEASEKLDADMARIMYFSATLVEKFQPIIENMVSKTIIDYTIVSGKTQAVLMAEVSNKMRYGWVPLGGVGAAAFGMSPVGGNQYMQAMVKYA